AMRLVVLERAGIDDANASEGEPRLFLEEGNVLDEPEGKSMLAAFEHAGVEQAVDVGDLHRSITDTALGALNLDGRLEPINAARSGAHNLKEEPARLQRVEQTMGDVVGADAERA